MDPKSEFTAEAGAPVENFDDQYRYFVAFSHQTRATSMFGFGNTTLYLGSPPESHETVKAMERFIKQHHPGLDVIVVMNFTLLRPPVTEGNAPPALQFKARTDLPSLPLDVPVLVKQQGNPVPFMAVRESFESQSVNKLLKHPHIANRRELVSLDELESWLPVMEAFDPSSTLAEDWRTYQ